MGFSDFEKLGLSHISITRSSVFLYFPRAQDVSLQNSMSLDVTNKLGVCSIGRESKSEKSSQGEFARLETVSSQRRRQSFLASDCC